MHELGVGSNGGALASTRLRQRPYLCHIGRGLARAWAEVGVPQEVLVGELVVGVVVAEVVEGGVVEVEVYVVGVASGGVGSNGEELFLKLRYRGGGVVEGLFIGVEVVGAIAREHGVGSSGGRFVLTRLRQEVVVGVASVGVDSNAGELFFMRLRQCPYLCHIGKGLVLVGVEVVDDREVVVEVLVVAVVVEVVVGFGEVKVEVIEVGSGDREGVHAVEVGVGHEVVVEGGE